MTLEQRLQALATGVATQIKGLHTKTGNLANLTTADKTNLVASLNELKTSISAVASAVGAQINDGTTANNLTWSSNKISSQISTAVAAIVDSSPAAMDTLAELAAAITADGGAIAALTTAIGNRLRVDAVQTLTTEQQDQAKSNLGLNLGNTDADLLSTFNTALV